MRDLFVKLAHPILRLFDMALLPPVYFNKRKYDVISVNYSHSSDQTQQDTLVIKAELHTRGGKR